MVADSQRAGEVIRGIRALVQKDKNVVRSLLNLNAVIADTLRLVSSDVVLRESVVITEMDRSLPQVEAVPVQIQQVLLNLIMNALDAVEASRQPSAASLLVHVHLNGRERGSQCARFRHRPAQGPTGQSVRSFLFHQTNRNGHGIDHRPLHC